MAQSIRHQQQQQQQLLRDSWMTSVSTPSPPTPTSAALRNSASGKETIHSGHFMVSHFEAEAQDDEDTELLMPDPDESAEPIVELNTCTDVILAGTSGQPMSNAIVATSSKMNTSAVIDISLAKLFKCMNLAYRQKLTSPKWNSFKGIRLRWKDKIRLNNLIWRCWHMQFIMKKRTPVCQFASPLDVDLHSKPESVVLEGKYWKRQFDVIKAEYMKWRKFYRNRGYGTNAILDTVSEIDIFDWSPITSDKNLMSVDDYCWTADTLFSTINTPFPFPDPREIARAGIADFIQPSLGPLQPNLDDFMNGVPLQELINTHMSSRLAPVPEEGSDDQMFRSDVYDFPAIMGSVPMDSSMMQGATITDVTNTSLGGSQQLTDPLMCGAQSDTQTQTQSTASIHSFDGASDPNVLQYPQAMQQQMSTSSISPLNMNRTSDLAAQSQIQSQSMLNQNSAFMSSNTDASNNAELCANVTGAKKRPVKERGFRSQIFGRREPHNYDKSTPTPHQTNLYNQIIQSAQQNRNPIHLPQSTPLITTASGGLYSTNYMNTQNLQTTSIHNASGYMNALNLSSNNNYNLASNQMNQNVMNTLPNVSQQTQVPSQQSSPTLQAQSPPMKTNSNLLSLLSASSSDLDLSQSDSYKSSISSHSNAYKPYPASMKNSTFIQMPQRNVSLPAATMTSQQMNPLINDRTIPQLNAPTLDKEMFRSKSLPMNSTLQIPVMREEQFVVPKYQATKSASMRFRGRSNSMISKQHNHSTPSLPAATSEPMLKTLAQLLTSSNATGNTTVSNLKQSNVLATANVVPSTEVTLSQSHSQQKQQKPQSQYVNQFSNQFAATPLSPDHKFLNSPGTSTGESMQRRAGHIHAEQKRRYNIKNGFDMLHSLIPQLQQNPNTKLSKAAMLQKGAEYIRQLRAERDGVNQKMDVLRKERDALNNSLNHLHSILPANGAPVSRQRTSRVKELYNDYVRDRTLQNWKFWILGLIFEPLLNSYNTTVSVANMEELYRSALIWVDQHCSLVEIRPAVSDKLRYLSTTTDILSDPPSTLHEEVLKAISSNNTGSSSNLL